MALIIVAGILGGASVFAWDRTGSRNRSGALADAIDARDEALATAATLSDSVEGLQDGLARARAQATNLEGKLAAAQAELLAMVGPTLDDGKYFGALIVVGADQQPPRLVIDIQQWFTDQEAIAAAIEDGVIEPGEIIPNGYYIRNDNPRWRTIEIDPAATVSLTTYPYGQIDDPQIVSLERFADLAIDWSEYWITVEDAKVVAIEQQYIP
ncbi:MAG: hypothetical protein ACRDGO_01570 [Actinomycetota bacterium]